MSSSLILSDSSSNISSVRPLLPTLIAFLQSVKSLLMKLKMLQKEEGKKKEEERITMKRGPWPPVIRVRQPIRTLSEYVSQSERHNQYFLQKARRLASMFPPQTNKAQQPSETLVDSEQNLYRAQWRMFMDDEIKSSKVESTLVKAL